MSISPSQAASTAGEGSQGPPTINNGAGMDGSGGSKSSSRGAGEEDVEAGGSSAAGFVGSKPPPQQQQQRQERRSLSGGGSSSRGAAMKKFGGSRRHQERQSHGWQHPDDPSTEAVVHRRELRKKTRDLAGSLLSSGQRIKQGQARAETDNKAAAAAAAALAAAGEDADAEMHPGAFRVRGIDFTQPATEPGGRPQVSAYWPDDENPLHHCVAVQPGQRPVAVQEGNEDTTEACWDSSTGSNAYERFRAPEGARVLAVADEVESDKDDSEQQEQGGDSSSWNARSGLMNLPVAIRYNPFAKSPTTSSPGKHDLCRRHLVFGLAAAVVASLIIGLAVGLTLCRKEDHKNPSLAFSSPTSNSSSTMDDENIEYYYEMISQIFGHERLQDDPQSPYYRALKWIINEDPMRGMGTRDEPNSFLQRYTAAYLYFATTVDGLWNSCNPPTNLSSSSSPYFCTVKTDFDMVVPSRTWLSPGSECAWAGIECDELSQVTSIDLSTQNVSGTFPEGILRGWPFLQSLNLLNGYLRGPLPNRFLADLTHLVEVRIGNNEFTGSIPELWLSSSSLRAVRNLLQLDIAGCYITGTLPTQLVGFRNLRHLFLNNNYLSGTIPTEIGLLENLLEVDLSQNKITGSIPDSIQSWEAVKEVLLNHNQLSGTIPASIGKMKSMEIITLNSNSGLVGTIPDSLYDIPNLVVVDLHDCNLGGTLSREIGNLKRLRSFKISGNHFHGTIASEISSMRDLDFLWLHGNDFTGTIPVEFCFDFPKDLDGYTREVTADCAPDDEGHIELDCECCKVCCLPDGTDCQ